MWPSDVRCDGIERALGQKRDIRESEGILNKIWASIRNLPTCVHYL